MATLDCAADQPATGISWATIDDYTLRWQQSANGEIPKNAVVAGKYTSGETLYIGRHSLRQNRNEFIPGYIVPSERIIVMSYGTGTKISAEFDVLVSDKPEQLHWTKMSNKTMDYGVMSRSVLGGTDSLHQEPLYIGRTCTKLVEGKTWRGRRMNLAEFEEPNAILPGKIHLSHRCLYIGHGEKEYLFNDYEVLTMTMSPKTLLDQTMLHIKREYEDETILDLYPQIPKKLVSMILDVTPHMGPHSVGHRPLRDSTSSTN